MFDKNIELFIININITKSTKYIVYFKFKIRSFRILVYSNLISEKLPLKQKPSNNFILREMINKNTHLWYVTTKNNDYPKNNDQCIYYSKFIINNKFKYKKLINYIKDEILSKDDTIYSKNFCNINDTKEFYLIKALSKFL